MRLAVAGLLLGLLTIAAVPSPAPAAGRSQQPGLPAMVERVLPAVVSITIRYVDRDESDQPVPGRGIGSGVVVDSRGYIVTNNHVIDGAETISVRLTDERAFPATVVGVDRITDLAVIKVDAVNLPALRLGDTSRLRLAETVVAIGSPLWIEGPTVTVGVVSGLGRIIEEPGLPSLHDLVQTDAAINPGNSGGPLVNLRGEVVGINTALVPTAHGIGFAISANTARPIVERLIANGRVVRPGIGVGTVSVTPLVASRQALPAERGVLVRSGAATAVAGTALADGDLITAVEGQPVRDVHELHRILWRRRAGETVRVTLWRARQQLTVPVRLRSEE
jgi:S1-C subfamily serine protease